MIFIGFDTETYLISPGNPAPKMVCATFAQRFIEAIPGPIQSSIHLRDEGLAVVRRHLESPNHVLVGANIYYDLGVICAEDPTLVPLVFRAFHDDVSHQPSLLAGSAARARARFTAAGDEKISAAYYTIGRWYS